MNKQFLRQTLAVLFVLTLTTSVKISAAQTLPHAAAASIRAAGPGGGGGNNGDGTDCDPNTVCLVAVQ